MKKLAALFLAVFVCSCSFAQQTTIITRPTPTTMPKEVGSTNPLAVSASPISNPQEVPLTIATGTVTYLQNNASWTAGDSIFFNSRAKVYWGLIDKGATTTAALLQARGTPLESGDTPPVLLIDPAGCDLAIVADTAAAASVTVTIGGR